MRLSLKKNQLSRPADACAHTPLAAWIFQSLEHHIPPVEIDRPHIPRNSHSREAARFLVAPAQSEHRPRDLSHYHGNLRLGDKTVLLAQASPLSSPVGSLSCRSLG